MAQAVRCQNELHDVRLSDYSPQHWVVTGKLNACVQSAVRLTESRLMRPSFIDESRMLKLIEEGATDPDAIVSETWDEKCQ